MRYPYERFLCFLISRKLDVNEALERIDLPELGDMGYADRKERIRRTAPPALLHYLKQPRHDRELAFRDGILDWAESQGFRDLWERQKEFGRKIVPALEIASNLFLNPNTRTVLGTLLLAETPVDEIIEVIKSEFSTEINAEAIARFSSLFWDVDGMGRQEWDEFLPTLDLEQRHVIALGIRGMKPNDIRYAIGAETPSDPKEVLQDILTHAHHQFKLAMSSGNPMASGCFKWAELANRVASNMANVGGRGGGGHPEDDIPSRDVSASMFSVVVESPRVITLDDLDGEVSKNQSALDRAIEESAQ